MTFRLRPFGCVLAILVSLQAQAATDAYISSQMTGSSHTIGSTTKLAR